MITVIFQNGHKVTYHQANYLSNTQFGHHLYTKADGAWVATIPAGSSVIIEAQSGSDYYGKEALCKEFLYNIEGLPGGHLTEIKKKLKAFDSRDFCWKVPPNH